MANNYFAFKKFTVQQAHCAMKVTTDACLFGAWCAAEIEADNHIDKKLLDIGAGTGLLSLMIRQKANVHIDAVEIDAAAATQAAENAKAAGANIHVHHQDILHWTGNGYLYIVSNPPFYENELSSPSFARSVAHHDRGLHWKDLCHIISKKLVLDGRFFILVPFKRLGDINALLEQNGIYINKQICVQHSPAHSPTRIMIKGSSKKEPLQEERIVIKQGNDYSSEFVNLLQDYYLHL